MYDNQIAEQLHSQQITSPFTAFQHLKPSTDLQSLNLNWREKDLPQRERTKHVHKLHPYMGKFIPQLAEIFLRKFKPSLVYDPFCGSGTTLVEAKSLGIDSVGTDISIFNVLLSSVKTLNYDLPALDREVSSLWAGINNPNIPTLDLETSSTPLPHAADTHNEYLKTWFAKTSLSHLLAFKARIEGTRYEDLFKIVLSRSARSARLVTHYDLDFPKQPQIEDYYCYKHNRICHPTNEANKFLKQYLRDAVRRIKAFHATHPAGDVTVLHGDSRQIDLPPDIDLVLTSPPYVGLINYHEQHRYAYELLDLEDREAQEIGTAKRGSSKQAVQEYATAIKDVLEHTRTFLSPKAIVVIIVNDKYDLYKPSEIGFKQIHKLQRQVNRRTGRRANAFYEDILVWEKA